MTMENFDFIIDYEFLNNFHIDTLREDIIIPLKKEGIFFDCICCEESILDFVKDTNIIRKKPLSKEQILFFLSEFEIRKRLYSLYQKALANQNSSGNYIGEFCNLLFEKAVEKRASDIHIETLDKTTLIRFRIDGILKIFFIFEKEFSLVLSSYIKMLSKLDITQRRVPQDGSFSIEIENKKTDFRVSSMPTIYGESVVIRVLDNLTILKKLEHLGFSPNIYKQMKESLKLSSGLILIAGPTGSGKSTTLYSMLNELNEENKKIVTIEDPVEYKMKYIQQVEVNEDLGVDFKKVLRNVLRQDPDIILIGEIRDEISLSIALQASLTGHLVFASIHATNSIETFSRLKDLNANTYLLSSCLKYIYSQRLVLRVCKKCKNIGCKVCNYSGFYGRDSIAEVLKVDENISSLIMQNKDIKEYLKQIDFKSMLEDGKDKVSNNLTTLEEVYKVIDV